MKESHLNSYFTKGLLLLLVLNLTLKFQSALVDGVKLKETSRSRQMDEQEDEEMISSQNGNENTQINNSPILSSSSKRKSPPSYSSVSTGGQNYNDYSPSIWKDYLPSASQYYQKYAPIPDPIQVPVFKQPRYIAPEYMSDLQLAANNLPASFPGGYIPDNSVEPIIAASHHMSSHGDHGHGHGYGHGHGHGHHHKTKTHVNYKISAVNTDAIGLLGLLGLLSLFQGILFLLTTTTTTAAAAMMGGRRKKRDVTTESNDNVPENVVESLTRQILPSLNIIALISCGKLSMNCSLTEVCRANKIVYSPKKKFMLQSALGYKITNGIKNLLHKNHSESSVSSSSEIFRAAEIGKNAKSESECEEIYPVCEELRDGGVYAVPVLLPNTHPYYYDHVSRKVKK